MAEISRILVFTTAFRPMIGGSELALEEIINRLPDVFFDVVTPRHNRSFKAFEQGPNLNVYRIGPEGLFGKLIFPITGFFKALRLIRRHHYDFTHAFQASYGGGAAWLVKLFLPYLPFVLTMQEGKKLDAQPLALNWLRSLIIKKADKITVISNYLKNYVLKIKPAAHVTVIPNGVDLKKFSINNLQFTKKDRKEKIIITVSRLVEKNGVGDLIEAFYTLDTKYKILDTRLLIVGDGPLRESLKLKVKSLKLENKVDFVGNIIPDEIPKYLKHADVFVRPSLSEGLGTAFLEAMAAGVPIIGTPIGGIPDFLKDPSTYSEQATGLFCQAGNPENIALKIKMLLFDESLREKLAANGRKLVEEKYDWNKIAEEFRKQYGNTTIKQ